MTTPRAKSCLHCGSPIPLDAAAAAAFCCAGCEAVHQLLVDQQLTRYYDLARGEVLPVSTPTAVRSHAWLEPLLQRAAAGGSPICTLELDVQGIHCAACVWLMNELFRRRPGGASFTVNPALGKARLSWNRDRFSPGDFIAEVEKFGYLFGPSRKTAQRGSRELVVRLGVCVAATMNVMLFSFSFYFGLTRSDATTFDLFTRLSLLLATLVVAVGGWPFFKGAVLGLRRGVLHLDLPIALGIAMVYALSFFQAVQGRGDHAYLDTLCTFVTLMVVGRWLQQRVLDRNRQFLLQDDGAAGLSVRRRSGPTVEVVPAPRVAAGDRLVIAPGDLLPVEARLEGSASLSLDWITGEPHARTFAAGATVPAGAFNAGRSAVEALAQQAFIDSPLPALLSARPREGATTDEARLFDRLARWYVAVVLLLAAAGFALWWPNGLHRAVDVAAALLVVTCPCAIGIAIPLAYELVQARLRRAGVLLRSGDLLDRLQRVRTVIFDKTGTLTLSRLELVDPVPLQRLTPELRDAAYDLVSRSNHPVSRCLAPALAALGARGDPDAQVEEVAGQGLALLRGGRQIRLGSPAFAAPFLSVAAEPGLTVLSVDGEPVARLFTREAVRAGAAREVAGLRSAGFDVWLLSGDEPLRVAEFAARLGLPADRARGGQSPQAKADQVAELERAGSGAQKGLGSTLFLGDGVNDSLAFAAALCAGTPAIDRPVMPGKADFFLLGEDLAALGTLLSGAQELRTAVRRILLLAFAYNGLAIAVCLAGLMTPLSAAVAMPLSSISILLFTVARLAGSRAAPRAAAPKLQEALA